MYSNANVCIPDRYDKVVAEDILQNNRLRDQCIDYLEITTAHFFIYNQIHSVYNTMCIHYLTYDNFLSSAKCINKMHIQSVSHKLM